MYKIKRTDAEIDRVRNWAAEGMDTGTQVMGASYEDGVAAALAWIVGDCECPPDDE